MPKDIDYTDVIQTLEEVAVQLTDIKATLKQIESTLGDCRATSILRSYVTPYVDGLLGGGQIMMSLQDVMNDLCEEGHKI